MIDFLSMFNGQPRHYKAGNVIHPQFKGHSPTGPSNAAVPFLDSLLDPFSSVLRPQYHTFHHTSFKLINNA